MKKFYLALAAVAAIFAGCSKEVDNQTEPVNRKEKTVTLKASVSGLETKVSSDNAGFFKWQDTDMISVVTESDEIRQFSVYDMNPDGTVADFLGTIPEGGPIKLAIYPASEDHLAGGEELFFRLDDQVTWNPDASNMPMLGLADTGTSVQFFAVGGVLKLVLFNIPDEADYLQFCAASQQISGEFYIENVYADDPVIVTTGDNVNDKDKELLIDFSEDYSSSKVFYIPLPTGDIEGFTVNLLDNNLDELFSVTSGKTLNVVANKLIIAKAMNCASPKTVLSEVFDAPGNSTETVADYDKAGQTAYSGAVIDYSLGEGNQNTKIYQNGENSANTAGGAAPGELFLAKKDSYDVNGVFTITGIPTNVSNTLTLSFKSNQNGGTSHAVTTSTENVTVDNRQVEGTKPYTISYDITIGDNIAASTFDLIFTNSSASNARIDDILVQVAGQSFTAPVITADTEELTFAVGETSKEVTVSLANPVDGLGIGALVTGDNAENFTATIVGNTLTVAALAANPTDAAYTATVTLRASGAAAKTISITQESALVPNLTNLEATPGDSSAEVTWVGSEHATSYVAYLHTSETETPATGGNDVSSSINGCSLSLASLINDQTYYLYVKVDGAETGYVAPSDFVMVSFTPAGSDGKIYYEKVTSALADWSGEYLLVCERESPLALAEISNTSTKYGIGAEVEISNNKIESTTTTDAYKIVIAPATGEGAGYTLAFGDGYLNWSSGNSLSTNAAETDNTRWTITAGATSGNWIIANVNDSSREIWYNTGSPRFACYTGKNESSSGYAPVQLYKLADNREDAGMSWSADAATATYNTGNTLSFTAPTLNLGNASNISFASTDETIATISGTGAVTIKALVDNDVKEGSATIKAIFDGDTTYKPATASYTLTVVDAREAVDTPTFSPAAGEVEAGVEVTINSVTGATVYYTVNGSNPTTESTLYEGPITIDEAKTIKAIAVLSGYKPSDVAEAAYTVSGVQANDGSLEHPYTADEAYAIISSYSSGSGSDGSKYVTGKVVSVTGLYNSTMLNYYISSDGTSTNQIQVFRGKFVGNTNFSSADQVKAGDDVIVYGQLYKYNNTIEINTGNYIYSLNGKTKALTAGTLTATPDNDNKQITVEWGAATGTESEISYVVKCGTQSFNADAAGSHTFTMADYGSYQVSVTASADDAISVTASTSATLTDPTSGGGGEPQTSTLNFTAKCNGSGTADDGAVWTVTSDGTESNFDSTCGIHYGTNSASVTYVQLSTSDIEGTVTQVVVNARDARANATVSVTVGGTAFTCSGSATATNASADYTFTGSGSGEIVVRVARSSSNTKAIYVKSVEVTYTNN